ncbi:hypothetical protein QOM21_37285 [Streptomyces sp. Pv4-95]|uniref:hypothetical protein n=1 Tax=Streptomyces sp. Pv4-95 TaxID=3049543 RepID=UPI0038923717
MGEKKTSEKDEASTSEGIRMITEPNDEVPEMPEKSEEAATVGTLTIRYVNATPEITLSNGTAIPGEIVVVDPQGNPIAVYQGTALPVSVTTRGMNHAHGHFLPAGHNAVVPAGVAHPAVVSPGIVPVVLSDRALKRDVVGVAWA